MDPWVYAGAALLLGAVAGGAVAAARALSRSRAELRRELLAARADVQNLTQRIDALSAEVVQARRLAEAPAPRREVAPYLITGLVDAPVADAVPKEAALVRAIEVGRPQWVPAGPLREALVKTVALGHGVRRALSPERRDRILLEMRAEVRRSRRQRKADIKAARRYLRERGNPAA